ncbi:EAL domain-containing protein [Vibrio parahaemolyticus]|uniref:two-component system response regulator n=1 Tax=Vibrio parahaemolyticus TaxID=670 RepID=UPI0015DDC8D3|nr:EAL domain-containing protein [Vibrio parahaemolyticus]HBC3606935.1 EAL domain-containing protein [Vibrio parahaemolyticus]HCG5472042.1 EAL domain-containing protein [Vibrio parahaemolyticus]HCG5933509.1 EAL domain-containing protein [Vibrio parahaemolyticus]HCG7638097.1 EAL domain-containing protein [Vibrio parahaemolyticus]
MFSVSKSSPRILLVDDDADQITLLHQVLKTIGQVFFEQRSVDALKQAIAVKPDIILLDIQMPGMNGYEVLALLKNHSETALIPVIFITANDSVEEQLHCLRDGAVDFIAKPLQPPVVAARVRTQLMLRNREQRLVEVFRHARITLDSIGDAVITTDKECQVTYLNPAAELLIGMSMSDAEGLAIEDVMPLRIGNDGPSHINPLRLAISENRVVGMALNCQMRCQNGRWIPVEDSAAPLLSEYGEVIGGVIVFDNISESKAMALKMSHTLQHDQLTNLPNRFLLMEHLANEIEKAQRLERELGLIVLDINGFKLINEEFGFEYGDILLKKIAQCLKSQVHNDGMVSRHNADEFMILVPELCNPTELSNFALSIKETVQQFAKRHPELNHFSISMGLSVFPEDATDAQSLILHSDAALHRAKVDAIHDGVCFYSEEMESHNIARREHYSQIKQAINLKRVVALYQPMIDANTGKVTAVEALMRISDENGRLIPPVEFISLAEETRLIIPLGEQMIHLALAQLKQWQQSQVRLHMALNISPVQFLDPHFLPFLLHAIEEHGVHPSQIELEVTESLMLDNLQHVSRDMEQLRQLGITISIDDFGTGYSCLSYLKSLPVDVLKIDRSFVNQLTEDNPDESLVRTIAQLAKDTGLKCVAEGVENSFQVARLRAFGVTSLQGYHFSRPVRYTDIKLEYSL